MKCFQEQPWYFAHIPKSGGTSFSAFFDQLFCLDEIFPHQLIWDVGKISQKQTNKYQLFRGHFNAYSAQLAYRETRNLTVLRNPIDMALSSFKHVCQNKESRLYDMVVGENWSFEDFIYSTESRNLISNRMTKFLHLGANISFENSDFDMNVSSFRKFKRSIKEKQKRPQIGEKYSIALAYLKQCFWVGVLDEMPRSMNVLCNKLALPANCELPILNQSKHVSGVSDKAVSHLEAVNEFDLKLFDWAMQQLISDENNESCNGRISSQNIEKNYQEKHRKLFNKPLQDHVNFSMKDAMVGGQWFQRESDVNQSIFRWSGPKSKSFIDFWLKSKNYAVEIFISKHCLSNWGQLTIDANEKQMTYTVLESNEGWKLSSVITSDMLKKNGLLRLSFSIIQNKRHADVFGGKDQRQVGIALNRVTLK